MSGQTPGPWVPEKQWHGTAIKTPGGKETIARVNVRADTAREDANARLIAAAPDLLAAARAVYFQTYGHGPGQVGAAMRELGEAIEKAEGGS